MVFTLMVYLIQHPLANEMIIQGYQESMVETAVKLSIQMSIRLTGG